MIIVLGIRCELGRVVEGAILAPDWATFGDLPWHASISGLIEIDG